MIICNIFLIFPDKGIDSSCNLSPEKIISMKLHSLFSRENSENIINMQSARFEQRVVKLNDISMNEPRKQTIIFLLFLILLDKKYFFLISPQKHVVGTH